MTRSFNLNVGACVRAGRQYGDNSRFESKLSKENVNDPQEIRVGNVLFLKKNMLVPCIGDV